MSGGDESCGVNWWRELLRPPPLRLSLYWVMGMTPLLISAYLLVPDFTDYSERPKGWALIGVAAVTFLFPALTEEIVFRGWLNKEQSVSSITISTIVFVLWHPVGAFLFIPEAFEDFTDLRFLFLVAVFGVYFALARKQSQSIWSAIVCHWVVVVAWKGLGGAQYVTGG